MGRKKSLKPGRVAGGASYIVPKKKTKKMRLLLYVVLICLHWGGIQKKEHKRANLYSQFSFFPLI